ncbi:hypothetical protein, partial [Enterobacter ludwigii]|uniref:hypothetical protein n=1 Tax=Enterobacter ludwigii TaxID=299767 RepID=UPI002FD3F07D
SAAGRLTPVAYSLPSAFAEKVCFCTHPKTFQLRTIAALPEPAGRPTHGLKTRRSSMWLTIAKAIISVNRQNDINHR